MPTAISRPPDARTEFSRSAVAASMRPHSACILCSSMSSALHRQEGAGADVQGQRLAADAARIERLEQPRREVQRRSRGGDRPFLAREHRLIIVAVRLVRLAARGDVGRQRHPPGAFEQQLDGLLAMEVQQRRAVLRLSRRPRRDALAEVDRVADPRPLGVAQERLPFARTLALVQGRADARLPAPAPRAARGSPSCR